MNSLHFLRRYPWIWPVLASATLFALILLLTPVVRYGVFTANLAAASFLALVGIGQMFPIASGEGGVDLSIPFVMNFCAFLAVKSVDDSAISIFYAVGLSTLFGMAVGFINGTVVTLLRIPPIIATLAVGYIVLTIVQIMSATGETRFTDRSFTDFIRSNVLGIPTAFFIVLAVSGVASLVIRRTAFGRSLLAVGQSRKAAELSGINVELTIVLAYVVSGALAGLTGTLLAASVGSADLELGNPYLLASVGAVVLGGNSIAGGSATLIGTVSGAILLTLLVAVTTVAGLPLEFQNVARGIVITLVLVVANVPGTAQRPWRKKSAKGASPETPSEVQGVS